MNGNPALMTLNRILNPEGYVYNLLKEYGAMYCYNRKDHLGNIREVWRAAGYPPSGTEQRTQYYPSGLPWASNTGDNPSTQPNKYNGKQFDEMHGYDTYDYGARGYYAAMGRFTTVDPLAEKHYDMSPYAYCMDNPIKYIDPLGLDSAQRANAVNKSEEYVNQNPGNSYKMGAKGEPGKKVDCSGMASKCIVAGGENDPVTQPNASGNGVTRIENASTEVNLQNAQVGNVIVLDDSNHIGIITNVLRDENGKVTGYEFNDSGGDPSSENQDLDRQQQLLGKIIGEKE